MRVTLEGKNYEEKRVVCPDCKYLMNLRMSKQSKLFYSCCNCKNFHHAYPNGNPRGEPVSLNLKAARSKSWVMFCESGGQNNRKAYAWLKRAWGTSKISEFNQQQCEELQHRLFVIQEKKGLR